MKNITLLTISMDGIWLAFGVCLIFDDSFSTVSNMEKLRFQLLHTLSLDKVEANIESIVGLKSLRKLELRAIKTSSLSFLKQLPIEDLSLL